MIKEIIISFIRIFFINWGSILVFTKIRGYKKFNKKEIILIIVSNLIISSNFALICGNPIVYDYSIIIHMLCYMLYAFVSALIINIVDNKFLIALLISLCISLVAFSISGGVSFILTRFQLFNNITNSILEYLIIGNIQILLIYGFFRIKRFKDGFGFIKDKNTSKGLIIMEAILGFTIITYILFVTGKNIVIRRHVFNCIAIGVCTILFLTRKSITKHYKLKMKDRTVELLNEQINEKDKKISELKEELANVHKINHKYSHRISAMEKAVANLKFNEEFAKENGDLIELVESLSKEYKEELEILENKKNKLCATGLKGIDNILEYMAEEAKKHNIDFKLKVECDLNDITNKIPGNKLETILADHINDAIIAINFSKQSNKQILVVLNKVNNNYQIKIYDTGIEFEIDTSVKLGLEEITTHKDTRRKRNRICYNI